MPRRFYPHLFALVAVIGLFASSFVLSAQDTTHRGRKYKSPPSQARIEVSVVRDVNGKAIENAAVIFHLVGDKGNMELKTNEDGKALIDVLPQNCEVILQIIAPGFQTYGADYKIDKPTMAFEIRMKRPGEQYSIYKDHPEKSVGGKPEPVDSGSKPAPNAGSQTKPQ
jgi:hypothetical protein